MTTKSLPPMDKKPLVMVAVVTLFAIALVVSITMIGRAAYLGAVSLFGG